MKDDEHIMKEEAGSAEDHAEADFLDRLLSTHFKDRCFFLLYERENGKTGSVQRNITFGEMINACVNMQKFLQAQCQKQPPSENQ